MMMMTQLRVRVVLISASHNHDCLIILTAFRFFSELDLLFVYVKSYLVYIFVPCVNICFMSPKRN